MKELRECPFCGGEAYWNRPNYYIGNVSCADCHIGTLTLTKPDAIELWNTRPEGYVKLSDVTIDEEKVFKLLVRAKSTFLNPQHYTLKEQEDYIRKDAKALSSADILTKKGE